MPIRCEAARRFAPSVRSASKRERSSSPEHAMSTLSWPQPRSFTGIAAARRSSRRSIAPAGSRSASACRASHVASTAVRARISSPSASVTPVALTAADRDLGDASVRDDPSTPGGEAGGQRVRELLASRRSAADRGSGGRRRGSAAGSSSSGRSSGKGSPRRRGGRIEPPGARSARRSARGPRRRGSRRSLAANGGGEARRARLARRRAGSGGSGWRRTSAGRCRRSPRTGRPARRRRSRPRGRSAAMSSAVFRGSRQKAIDSPVGWR